MLFASGSRVIHRAVAGEKAALVEAMRAEKRATLAAELEEAKQMQQVGERKMLLWVPDHTKRPI